MLFIVLAWLVLGGVVLVLYLLRGISPVKEFVSWALSVWPILFALGGIALVISGWIIKHDFATKPNMKELDRLRDIGVQLRNEVQYQMRSHRALVEWQHRAEAWENKVVVQIEPIDQIWAGRIRTLNRFESNQAPVSNPIVELVGGIEHQRWADMQNERLARLDAFLQSFLAKNTTGSGL